MKRFRLFVENFLIYGLGSIISQIIPIVMLPVIARLMPDTFYFGLNDIFTTVVSFGMAFALLGMYDAMFRMFFEKDGEEYKREICSTTLLFNIVVSIIVFCILILFRKNFSNLFFSSREYEYLVIIAAINILVGSTNSIVAAPTRMENKRKIFLVTNALSPIISYVIAIPLLLQKEYVIALPLASTLSVIITEMIFFVLNRKWFSLHKVNTKHLNILLKIALPLVPNFLVYWMFSSCDRFMISKMIGMEYSGIYAMGAKMGAAAQLIYTAFANGWQYFSFSTMNDDDQVNMTSKIFEYLGIITFSTSMIVAALSEWFYSIVFVEDYIKGAVVAPYLFMAPLLLMLYQVAGNQFLIIKKTWPNVLILAFGAIINILVNYFGIKSIGIEGAGLGTLCGYIVSVILIVIVLSKMALLNISKRFYISVIITVVYAIIWRFIIQNNVFLSLIVSFVAIAMFIMIYIKDIKGVMQQRKKM